MKQNNRKATRDGGFYIGEIEMELFKDLVTEPPKAADPGVVLKGNFKIQKSDDGQRLAFGWASVAVEENGQELEDLAGDIISQEELENAAYKFVLQYREGGEMHERGDCAVLIESMVFTPEKLRLLGLQEDALPTGWWLGFYVTDDVVWEKVKNGEYSMFSIEGEAIREPAGDTK